MSIVALDWAFKTSIENPGAKLVLLTLANYADENHQSYPSKNCIAELTGIKYRTITDHLSWLEEQKLIKKLPRFSQTGGQTSCLFELAVICLPPRQNLPGPQATTSPNTQEYTNPELRSGANAPARKISKPKERSTDPVWGELLYALVDHHGAEESSVRKELGALTGRKGFGQDFVQAIYAENRRLILDADEPLIYLRKLLQVHKDTTPEQREAEKQLREAKRYHIALYQNMEFIPEFDASKYLGRFPLLAKLDIIGNNG